MQVTYEKYLKEKKRLLNKRYLARKDGTFHGVDARRGSFTPRIITNERGQRFVSGNDYMRMRLRLMHGLAPKIKNRKEALAVPVPKPKEERADLDSAMLPFVAGFVAGTLYAIIMVVFF